MGSSTTAERSGDAKNDGAVEHLVDEQAEPVEADDNETPEPGMAGTAAEGDREHEQMETTSPSAPD